MLQDKDRWAYAGPIGPHPMQALQDIQVAAGNACPQPPPQNDPEIRGLELLAAGHDLVLHKEFRQWSEANASPCCILIGDELHFIGDCYKWRTYLVSAIESDDAVMMAEPFRCVKGEAMFKDVLRNMQSDTNVFLIPLKADHSTPEKLSRNVLAPQIKLFTIAKKHGKHVTRKPKKKAKKKHARCTSH